MDYRVKHCKVVDVGHVPEDVRSVIFDLLVTIHLTMGSSTVPSFLGRVRVLPVVFSRVWVEGWRSVWLHARSRLHGAYELM